MLPNLLHAYIGAEEVGDETHYTYNDVWTSFAKDALGSVFLWAAIALAVILIAVGVFVRFKKQESFGRFVKTAIALAVGFAVTVIVTMLALEFYDIYENGYVFDMVLWPTVAFGIVLVASVAAAYVCSLFSQKTFKVSLIVCGSLCAAAFIALIVCLAIYYGSGDAAGNNLSDPSTVKDLALYLSTAGVIVVVALLTVFFGKGEKKGFDTRSIAYAAICIAMSFALSYIRIVPMPQGGSITLASLLPLMIYSYMFGVRKGVFAGFIYGILQAVQDPWILHPAQFLLDYPVAFAAIGLTGMFRRVKAFEKLPQVSFALGAIVAGVLRFVSHVFSGVFAFSEYAGGDNPWLYSLGYNAFVFADIAIVIVVGVLLLSSRAFLKEMNRYSAAPAAQGKPSNGTDETSKDLSEGTESPLPENPEKK